MRNHIKSAFIILLALCLSLCMIACAGNSGNENNTNEGSSSTEITTLPEQTEPDGVVTRPDMNTQTEPTDPSESVPETVPATTPETEPETTKPSTQPAPSKPTLSMNYQQYMALSGAAQQEFYDQYFSDNPLGFASWFQKIKQEYDDGRTEIEGTGPIDIGDYINP